jgi:hypothetical protein
VCLGLEACIRLLCSPNGDSDGDSESDGNGDGDGDNDYGNGDGDGDGDGDGNGNGNGNGHDNGDGDGITRVLMRASVSCARLCVLQWFYSGVTVVIQLC